MTSKLSIIFQTDPLKGLDIALNKSRISIGRDPNNDIVVDHIEVSRKHALIEVNDDHVTITDVGSLNGTFVDGEQISGAASVLPGQVIEISEAVRFVLAEQESQTEKTLILEAEPVGSALKAKDTLTEAEPDVRGLDDFEPFYAEDKAPAPNQYDPDEVVRKFRKERAEPKKNYWIVAAILLGALILAIVAFVWYIDTFSLWCDVLPFLFDPGLCP